MHDAPSPAGAFEALPLPAYLVDADGCLVRANRAAVAMFGERPRGARIELDDRFARAALDDGKGDGRGGEVWVLADADAARVAQLAQAGAEAGTLAHDVKNARTAVHLALRAVARELGEDEVGVLEDLAARLASIEERIRRALG